MTYNFDRELASKCREIPITLEGRAWLVEDCGDCVGSILAVENDDAEDDYITLVGMIHGVIVYTEAVKEITPRFLDRAQSAIMKVARYGD